jgi:hypothetical protein
MSTQEVAVDSAAPPLPTAPRSRFAVPEADLEAGRVKQAEMVQEVPNPHRVPVGGPHFGTGIEGSGADGDGDGD